MSDTSQSPRASSAAAPQSAEAEPAAGNGAQSRMRDGARQRGGFGIDGVSAFMGLRWDDPQTVRLTIRPELINAGGLLSGVVTYALVDYCMGSTLWAQTSEQERIATIGISINYIQTATEGEIVCSTQLDRRNRTTAVMRSEVRHQDGRLLVTAIGSYAIFIPRARKSGDGGVVGAGESVTGAGKLRAGAGESGTGRGKPGAGADESGTGRGKPGAGAKR